MDELNNNIQKLFCSNLELKGLIDWLIDCWIYLGHIDIIEKSGFVEYMLINQQI